MLTYGSCDPTNTRRQLQAAYTSSLRPHTHTGGYPVPLTCAFFVFFSAREAMCLGSLGELSFEEEDFRTGMLRLKLPL
jgi:hypothetical protein